MFRSNSKKRGDGSILSCTKKKEKVPKSVLVHSNRLYEFIIILTIWTKDQNHNYTAVCQRSLDTIYILTCDIIGSRLLGKAVQQVCQESAPYYITSRYYMFWTIMQIKLLYKMVQDFLDIQ